MSFISGSYIENKICSAESPDLMTFLCGSSTLGVGLHHSC